VLVELADDFPMLASLVDRRLGGQRRLPIGKPKAAAGELAFTSGAPDAAAERAEASASEALEPPAESARDAPLPEAEPPPSTIASPAGAKLPARYGLSIQFRSLPDDDAVARLVDATAWINEAHPAYRRAVRSRSEGYHLALAVALALAPLAAEPTGHVDFVTAFLARWGGAVERPRGRGRRAAGRASRRG
jgi:hypothetical protein